MSTTENEHSESSLSSEEIDEDRFLAVGKKLLQLLADGGDNKFASSSTEFETLSKEFKELYNKNKDSESMIALSKLALESIEKERSEQNSDDKPLLALEETYGCQFLMIFPLTDDDIMLLLLDVMLRVRSEYRGMIRASREYTDLTLVTVPVLCCEISIYIKFGRCFSPDTASDLASILKEYRYEDATFTKVSLTLASHFLFYEKLVECRDGDRTRQAEAILIPICFEIMGSAKGRIDDYDQIRLAAFLAIGVVEIRRPSNEFMSNRLYDALNRQEEDQVAGVCVFLRMLVSRRRLSDDNAVVEEGENILRSMQEEMVSALRCYPSNKVLVESALQNLSSRDVEFLLAFVNEPDGLTVLLDAMRTTATPKAYKEGTRILQFVLEAGMDGEYEDFDDQRRPLLDRDGISIILDAIRIDPYSKALTVLMMCSTIRQPQAYINQKIVQPIIDNDSIASIVTATIIYMKRRFSSEDEVERNSYHLLRFLDFLVTKKVRGADSGSLLHFMAAASAATVAVSSTATEEFVEETEENVYWLCQYIDIVRSKDPSLDLLRDDSNRLPLHVAIQSKQSEAVIQELVKGNKSVCTQLCNGLLPFQLAAQEDCDIAVIYLLLKENPTELKDTTNTLAPMFKESREETAGVTPSSLKKRRRRGERSTREEENVTSEKKKPKA